MRTPGPPKPPRRTVRRLASSDPFDWDLPYAEAAAERAPALQLLRLAMAAPAAPGERALAAECGVFRGHLLVAAAQMAEALGSDLQFIGLDSFRGFPPPSPEDVRLVSGETLDRATRAFADTTLRFALDVSRFARM